MPWLRIIYAILGSILASLVLVFGMSIFHRIPTGEITSIGMLLSLLLSCVALAYMTVRNSPRLIISPMPWFLLASGAYFGFGPLLYSFGNELAIAFSQSIWFVGQQELLRVTIVNATGVLIVYSVWFYLVTKAPVSRASPPGTRQLRNAIFVFYAVGIPPRCLNIFAEIGLLSFTLPGFLFWVANLTGAGLVLLTIMTLRKGGGWWALWGVMLTMDLLGALVVISKSAILLAVMPCVFGYLLNKPKKAALWWIPVFLLVVYFLANSFVTFARERLLQNHSTASRVGMAQAYLESDEEKLLDDVGQLWWVRLNYANAQEFAMQEYQAGHPGNSLKLALIAPIPRILWPGKPIIESGREFYERLTGEKTATFGIGFFSEAYWNGGWIAVILCSAAIGWLFARITMVLGAELALGNVWALPFALLWIRSGARVDGWVHTEIVGPAVFTLIAVVVMRYWLGNPRERIAKNKSAQTARKRVPVKSS